MKFITDSFNNFIINISINLLTIYNTVYVKNNRTRKLFNN